MATENYGVIQILSPAPTGAGGQLLLNNDKALNDARGVRKVPNSNSNKSPALVSELGLDFIANAGDAPRTFGSGAVNLQSAMSSMGEGAITDGDFSTISGGQNNIAKGNNSTIIGGYQNYTGTQFSIAGGKGCTASGAGYPMEDNDGVAISLGYENVVYADYATAIGGYNNNVSGSRSVILGGSYNYSYSNDASILCCSNSQSYGSNSVIIGGNNNTMQSVNHSSILSCFYSQQYASYSAMIGGNYLTSDMGDSYGIVYGQGGNSSSTTGRAVIRGLATHSSYATTLSLEVASIGSAGASLVEVDVLHGNSSTFTVSQYLVKVIGTTVTVLETKGDEGQGTFSMINGKLTYTSSSSLTALRANVRITTMSTSSNNYYYYYYYY